MHPTEQEFAQALLSLHVRSKTGYNVVHHTAQWVVWCVYPDYRPKVDWARYTGDGFALLEFDSNVRCHSIDTSFMVTSKSLIASVRANNYSRVTIPGPLGRRTPILDLCQIDVSSLGKRAGGLIQTVHFL